MSPTLNSMMNKLTQLIFTAVLCGSAWAADPTPDERFAGARAAFDKGDFAKAQYQAEAMIKDGLISREIMELLGHSRYRLGDLGRATLWYRRAALFPPPTPELRQNIAHIHDRTGNVSFPSNGFLDQLSAWLSRSQWLQLAMFCGWTVLLTTTFCVLYASSNAFRALLLTGTALALIVGVISLVGLAWHPTYDRVKDVSIITASNTRAYTAASTTAGSVTELRAGSEVRTLQDRGAWCYVEIPADNESRRGWVQKDALTVFWPFDAGYLQ